MTLTNQIMIVIGVIIILIGIAAFLNPNFARIINAPGGPKIKGIIALTVGIIILLIGLVTQLPV